MFKLKRRIRTDLILTYIAIMIITALIMSGVAFYQAYQFSVQKNRVDIERISEQAYNSLQSMFNQLNSLQMQAISVIINSKPDNLIQNGNITREYLTFYKTVEEDFMTLRRSFPLASDIYWFDELGFLISSTGGVKKQEFEQNPWINKLQEDEYNSYLSDPHVTTYHLNEPGNMVFSYARNIFKLSDISQKEGILQIDIPYSHVSEMMYLLNTETNCLPMIVDEFGDLVWFHDLGYLRSPFDEAIRADEMEQRYATRLSYQLSNGWQLIVNYNNRAILENIQENMSFPITVLLLLLLSILIPLKFSNMIVNPLHALMNRMKAVEQWDLVETPIKSSYREIQVLEQSYNSMISKIADMMESMVSIRSENIQAKLSALQMQINPHFLSNCFDMIKSLALKDGNREVANITDALSMMYRYVMDDRDILIPLSEEFRYIRNYIRIQEYRFGQTIEVLYRIEPGTLSTGIFRLLLQPIVENAFVHGLEPQKGKRWILISCSFDNNRVLIEVRDNGIGIEPKQLEKLLLDIRDFMTEEKTPCKERLSVGLRNVNHRLYLHYGQDSCLNIESTLDEGTNVSFSIPTTMPLSAAQGIIENNGENGKCER